MFLICDSMCSSVFGNVGEIGSYSSVDKFLVFMMRIDVFEIGVSVYGVEVEMVVVFMFSFVD